MYASIKNATQQNHITLKDFNKQFSDKFDIHKKFPCERFLFYLVQALHKLDFLHKNMIFLNKISLDSFTIN